MNTDTYNYIIFDVLGTKLKEKGNPEKTELRGEVFVDWVDEKQWLIIRTFMDGKEDIRCITNDKDEFYINLDAECRILNSIYESVENVSVINYRIKQISHEMVFHEILVLTTNKANEKFQKDIRKNKRTNMFKKGLIFSFEK